MNLVLVQCGSPPVDAVDEFCLAIKCRCSICPCDVWICQDGFLLVFERDEAGDQEVLNIVRSFPHKDVCRLRGPCGDVSRIRLTRRDIKRHLERLGELDMAII
jgi:hypothetical protein